MSEFANKLNYLRKSKKWSMQTLSESAGVSVSMISKLERQQVQPTLDVALRIAEALDTNLSAMLEEDKQQTKMHLLTRDEQTIYVDPDNQMSRRMLTPAFCSCEWIHMTMPPGAKTGELIALPAGSMKYIYVLQGELELTMKNHSVKVAAGDSLCFEPKQPQFHKNLCNDNTTEYLLICQRPEKT